MRAMSVSVVKPVAAADFAYAAMIGDAAPAVEISRFHIAKPPRRAYNLKANAPLAGVPA
jgi:hypothetical protein